MKEIKPVKTTKAYMQIVDKIIDLVINNEIEYGDKLYSEPELTKLLNVSRPTLREALRVLEFLDIVNVSPRRGIRINKPESTDSYKPLIYMLKFEKTTELELFELRRAIQISMVEPAARNRTEEDLTELKEIVDSFTTYIDADYEIFADLDYNYHMQIIKCSQNLMCYKLMKTLSILMKNQMRNIIYNLPKENRADTLKYHTKIYEAIRDKDSDKALKLMSEHMERPYAYFMDNNK